MSDVATSYKWGRGQRPVSKSGDNTTAKKQTSLRKAAGWLPGLFRAGAIKFAHSQSGDSRILRGVFGRRRSQTAAVVTNGDSR